MPQRLRCTTGGFVYHVLNRAVDRATLFYNDGDYAAFETVVRQAKEWRPIRLLAYTLMPNHGAWSFGPSATATCRNSSAG
jgi:REP-associated tyrosine transposase